MSTSEQTARPAVGAQGTPCATCGAPLAADQRYCLECGTRRGDARLPYERYLGPNGSTAYASTADRPNEVSPLGVILGVALLGGMLLIGVLLGRGENDEPAPAPTVIEAGEAATTTPQAGTDVITSEWPPGQDGFTVELGTLPKANTTSEDIDATKSGLEAQGASALGVLDSDLYPSLPPGNYVIYSGVYEDRAGAEAALAGLQASIPSAELIKVSDKAPGGGASSDSGAGGNDDAGAAIEQPAVPEEIPDELPASPTPELKETGGATEEPEVPPATEERTPEKGAEADAALTPTPAVEHGSASPAERERRDR